MDVFNEIKEILAEILDVGEKEVTPESLLIRDLGAESIDLLELTAALNQKFRIEINEEDIFLRAARDSFTKTANKQDQDRFSFLTDERRREIAAEPGDGPVLKVKDLVSYVTWRLREG